MEIADQILDPLVGDDPADKQDICPIVVEILCHQPVRQPIQMREVGYHRQHGGAGKPERFEVLTVELRVAERQVAAVCVRPKLAPAAIRI